MKTNLIFFAALLMALTSAAQVKYTALIPPQKISDSLIIDINLDGIPDFILKHIRKKDSTSCSREPESVVDYVSLIPLNKNEFTTYPLEYGSTIDNNQKWNTIPAYLAWTSHNHVNGCHLKLYKHGAWLQDADEYTGLRISVNGQSYYGWIRLEVAHNATYIIVYDFAFSNKPAMGIFCRNN